MANVVLFPWLPEGAQACPVSHTYIDVAGLLGGAESGFEGGPPIKTAPDPSVSHTYIDVGVAVGGVLSMSW